MHLHDLEPAQANRDRHLVVACLVVACLGSACMFIPGQTYDTFTTPTPLGTAEVLILGFQGGRDDWDDDTKAVRTLALRLRAEAGPGVWIETVENKERELAVALVRQAFDHDRSGALEPHELERVRLIVYGQSFGGAAVVKLARDLERLDVPIALTIQVDSVGRGDGRIPANVARAANLYQKNGWFIRGEEPIRAADPRRTVILGNFEYDYADSDISLDGVPWYKRLFRVAHAKMDRDPRVWERVESLIRAELERWRR